LICCRPAFSVSGAPAFGMSFGAAGGGCAYPPVATNPKAKATPSETECRLMESPQ
jgi:hypothetical protein